MVKPVPLEEAFGDTPAFHTRLKASETSLNDVENSIRKMVHVAEKITEMSKDYSTKYDALAEEIQTVAGLDDDPAYAVVGQQASSVASLLKFAQALKDIERCRIIAAGQFKDVFINPLNNFVATEIQPTKKAGREFQHAQDQYLNALSKYMGKRSMDKGIDESNRDAAEARKNYHTKTVEYGSRLNNLDMKRKFELVENIAALVYTNSAFFHQAYDTLKDLEPSMRDLTAMLQRLRSDHSKINPKAYAEHILSTTPPDLYDPSTTHAPKSTRTPSTIYKGGYLYKKSSSKMRTLWQRRYFELMNSYLAYFSLEGKDEAKTTIDLRICMVKETPNPERRFCFDLVSPNKTLTLQAQSEDQLKDWMTTLQAAISRSISDEGFHDTLSKPTFGEMDQAALLQQPPGRTGPNELTKQIHEIAGNNNCADCNSTDDVEWASCNLGVILCITCSGIHRGLGRHVSKMKSLALDRWDQESGDVLLALGNERVNAVYEGALRKDGQLEAIKPKPGDERSKKQKYCVEKYVDKSYILPITSDPVLDSTPLQSALHTAVKNADLPLALRCLAYGANSNERDLTGQTMLHKACENDDATMVEFLLGWNAEVDVIDERGWTPLHVAAETGNVNAVLALLRRNAHADIRDKEGKLAIDHAITKSTTDDSASSTHIRIVTILRLTNLDNETKASGWKAQDTGIDEALKRLSKTDLEEEAVKESHIGGGQVDRPVVETTQTSWNKPPAAAGLAGDMWAEEKDAWAK